MDSSPTNTALAATATTTTAAVDAASAAPSRLRIVEGGMGVDADGAPRTNEDGELMLRYRRGDVHAFDLLYARHKGALYRYLQRMCKEREVANDLFQEVWSRVIASRDRYEIRAQFTTFLFQIAHNCAIDYFRRAERQRVNQTDDVDEIQDRLPGAESERPDAKAAESELRAAFKRALSRLPDEQRQAFVLREEGGMSLEEIGKTTGVTMETAKSRLRYALSKLRAAMAAYETNRVQT